jgi:cell division protein FtsL
MKSKFLVYALVFAVLLVVFQYVNSMRIIEKYENDIEVFKMKIEKLETENTALKAQMK